MLTASTEPDPGYGGPLPNTVYDVVLVVTEQEEPIIVTAPVEIWNYKAEFGIDIGEMLNNCPQQVGLYACKITYTPSKHQGFMEEATSEEFTVVAFRPIWSPAE